MSAAQISSVFEVGIRYVNDAPRASARHSEGVCAFGSSPAATATQFSVTGIRKSVNWKHDTRARLRILCMATTVNDAESSSRLPKTSPFKVLGLDVDCSEEDIKAAFRTKVKEFHPDVYKGTEDAIVITQRLIQAYELLIKRVHRGPSKRSSNDPFEDPECEADDVFVNELSCIGRGCPYSCVERAPQVFRIATDTGRARAVGQGLPGDYSVQLAVGQCPRNCIYYVTPLQRETLERVLERAFEGIDYSNEVALLEDLLARAGYENGRYTPRKRKSNVSTKWVDWY